MADILEALRNAGLVSNDAARRVAEQDRQKRLRESGTQLGRLENAANRAVTSENLASAESPRAFRVLAMNMLLADPSMITLVVNEAHRFKSVDGGTRLIAQVLQLRTELRKKDRGDHEPIVRRALRKSARAM